MIFILLEHLKQKIKKIKLNMVNPITFVILLILIGGVISYFWLNKSASIYQVRNNNGFHKVENYEYTKIVDKNEIEVLKEEYEWNLGRIDEKIDCVTFYTIYQYVDVYIDNELIYSLNSENNKLISTLGRNWVMIPLEVSDSYKQLKIELTPTYKCTPDNDLEFLMGLRMHIVREILKDDLPCIILGITIVGLGAVFCLISLFYALKKKIRTNLIYLSILAFITGFWRIFDTKICNILFPYSHAAIGLIVFYTDMLLGIPCILFIQSCFKKKYLILDILCALNVMNGFIMAVIHPIFSSHILEKIIINNVILLISASTSMIISYKELQEEKHNKQKIITLVCIIMCCISAIIDIVLYYIKGTSVDLIITTASFLIFFVILGMMSIYNLCNRAEKDMHTGLYNKSECLVRIEDKSIISEPTAVFMFDLNNLKMINDTYGHKSGDKLIYDFAQIILESVPMRAFAGRFGGDEFIIILNRIDQIKIQHILSDMQSLADAYNKDNACIKMSYSYGYAISTDFNQCTMQMLMEKADYKLYLNKNTFHNNCKKSTSGNKK